MLPNNNRLPRLAQTFQVHEAEAAAARAGRQKRAGAEADAAGLRRNGWKWPWAFQNPNRTPSEHPSPNTRIGP